MAQGVRLARLCEDVADAVGARDASRVSGALGAGTNGPAPGVHGRHVQAAQDSRPPGREVGMELGHGLQPEDVARPQSQPRRNPWLEKVRVKAREDLILFTKMANEFGNHHSEPIVSTAITVARPFLTVQFVMAIRCYS